MQRAWVTNGSTKLEGVVNPFIAACDDGFVPDTIYILSNPGVECALEMMGEVIEATVSAPRLRRRC